MTRRGRRPEVNSRYDATLHHDLFHQQHCTPLTLQSLTRCLGFTYSPLARLHHLTVRSRTPSISARRRSSPHTARDLRRADTMASIAMPEFPSLHHHSLPDTALHPATDDSIVPLIPSHATLHSDTKPTESFRRRIMTFAMFLRWMRRTACLACLRAQAHLEAF
jgi:hypothetical protein